MTDQQTCPHCGCSKYNDEVYLCHTKVSDPSMSIGVRSIHCHQLYELKVKLAAKEAEIEWVVNALRNLVNDSQHKDHDCGDTLEHCPVLAAREVVSKYGKR